MKFLITIYYQLDKNVADYLKTLQNRWAFFDLKPYKVYSLTIQNGK